MDRFWTLCTKKNDVKVFGTSGYFFCTVDQQTVLINSNGLDKLGFRRFCQLYSVDLNC